MTDGHIWQLQPTNTEVLSGSYLMDFQVRIPPWGEKNLLKNFHLEDKIGHDKDEGKVVPYVPYKDGGRVEVQLHSVWTSAVDGSSRHAPAALTPGRGHGTRWYRLRGYKEDWIKSGLPSMEEFVINGVKLSRLICEAVAQTAQAFWCK